MNALGTFLPVRGYDSKAFSDASQRVPVAPESGEQPVTRRGRKPGRRRIFSVPSDKLRRRLETLFNGKRGKLCGTAKDLADRCGEYFPGAGVFVEERALEASGVQKRQFDRHLAELAPTFKTRRAGHMLHVWSRELAADKAWPKSDEELREGLLALESQGYLFLAEARGFFENLIGARKYDKRKNIVNSRWSPETKSWSRSTLEKPGFGQFKSPDLKLRIPEEDLPRPEGGSSWERRSSLSERQFIDSPSSLSGSARSEGIFEFLDEDREDPEGPGRAAAVLRSLLPPLPSGPVLPRADTETRIQGAAASQVAMGEQSPVLDDSERPSGTRVQRNGRPLPRRGPSVRKAGEVTMTALWAAYHRLMRARLPGYVPTCSAELRKADGAALQQIGRRYCGGKSLAWLEDWLGEHLTLYVKEGPRRDGHPPRGFLGFLERRDGPEGTLPDILGMLMNRGAI